MTDKARNPRALNALKGAVPASAQIQMRIPPDIKKRYVAQALQEGMKLSEWIQLHLNAVCQSADDAKQQDSKISD